MREYCTVTKRREEVITVVLFFFVKATDAKVQSLAMAQ